MVNQGVAEAIYDAIKNNSTLLDRIFEPIGDAIVAAGAEGNAAETIAAALGMVAEGAATIMPRRYISKFPPDDTAVG